MVHDLNNNNNNQAHFYRAMTSPQTILGRFTKLLDLGRCRKTAHSQLALSKIGFRDLIESSEAVLSRAG